MADIKLGINRAALDEVNESYSGPRMPFPATKLGYTKYTGNVSVVDIKEFQNGGSGLWIGVENGPYSDAIIVNLDPTNVAPNAQDKEKAQKQNLERLLRAIKALGIANAAGDGIDTAKFAAAKGTPVAFGVKMGDKDRNGYDKYSLIFYGKAEEVLSIGVSAMHATSDNVGGSSVSPDDDIPF